MKGERTSRLSRSSGWLHTYWGGSWRLLLDVILKLLMANRDICRVYLMFTATDNIVLCMAFPVTLTVRCSLRSLYEVLYAAGAET